MKSAQVGRLGAVLVLGLAAAEVLIMISPFAGFFYARLRFEPLLGVLAGNPATAWLDGFFLKHAVVTDSALLEWHWWAGLVLLVAGTLGFLVSAVQVYGAKILRRGVAQGLLYRVVRHPQYLCLGVAGYGLLVTWPRFLLLGIWVTMLFVYAGLARFEERRMEQRFGEAYRTFAAARGALLPGSPVRRLFERTFGRIRPRAVGWAASYVFCLSLAFAVGFALRAYTVASSAVVVRPDDQAIVISAWPRPAEWVSRVFDAALASEEVRQRLREARDSLPIVATILPPRYGMRGMYYKPAPGPANAGSGSPDARRQSNGRWGVDPGTVHEPVEVVFSRAWKRYQRGLRLEDVLDSGVGLTPLVVVTVDAETGRVSSVKVPLPQNQWGPRVVMPIL